MFVNLIYFLETADKIATTAFLRVETITHFYRQQQQYFKIRLYIISFCLREHYCKSLTFGSYKKGRSCHSCLAQLRTIPLIERHRMFIFVFFPPKKLKMSKQLIISPYLRLWLPNMKIFYCL